MAGGDLASILRTLSSFISGTSSNPAPPDAGTSNGLSPAPYNYSSSNGPKEPSSHAATNGLSGHHQISTPEVDPRTILTWPAGLRYMSKLAARDERVEASVKKMIKNQKVHEQQWWTARQNLLNKQKERVKGRSELNQILGAFGSKVNADNSGNLSKHEAELRNYDLQVHKAQKAMFDDMMGRLVALGVPFFGTHSDLVVEDKPDDMHITSSQLKGLQQRMLGYLQDMYG